MNSLQLRSSTQNYEDSVENNTSDDPSNSRISEDSHSRRDAGCNLEISRSHVTLLREVFSPDKDGDTQLHVAVMRGFIEVVYHITRLLPHQAFLDLANNSGRTALHLAVSAGVPAIARHLIVCGASPVARDLRGNTPLHVACGRKDAAMVTHLTRPVTVTEVMNAHLSYAPTHTPGLVAADLTNYQGVQNYLGGIVVNPSLSFGYFSTSDKFLVLGKITCFSLTPILLLSSIVDPYSYPFSGETCVHVAAMAGDKEILQHLTWYGADVNAK
ncbi:hypothetical protein HAZT_HAZT006998, partial [Hyalella azteca]